MRKGFLYLTAIMELEHQKDTFLVAFCNSRCKFCLDALEEALTKYGPRGYPTRFKAVNLPALILPICYNHGIRISMDGRRRWRDNVTIERFWHSLKYECIYLYAFENGSEVCQRISSWLAFYNDVRPLRSLQGLTPEEKGSLM